jgi:hypothetical protein
MRDLPTNLRAPAGNLTGGVSASSPSFLTVWLFADVGDSRSGDAVLVGDVESLISVPYSRAEELVSRVRCFGEGRQCGSFQSFRLCAGRPPKQLAGRLQSSAPTTPEVSALPRIPLVITQDLLASLRRRVDKSRNELIGRAKPVEQ